MRNKFYGTVVACYKKLVMNKKQSSKINMFAVICLFFTKYNTILSAFPPLFAKITSFFGKETELKALLDEQGYNSKGKTMTKEMLREIMIGLVLPMAKLAKGWAMTVNNKDMLNIFEVSADSFKINEKALIVLIDAILKALEDNLTDLADYKITLIKITAAKAAVVDFSAAKNAPKQQTALKKTITANIKTKIVETTGVLEICDTLMEGGFADSEPTMVLEYQNGRKLIDTVGRHTTLRVHVYGDEDHSEPIEGADFSIVSLNRSEVTNVDGEGELVQFVGGDYVLNIKRKGFSEIDVPFSIKKGKLLELDIVMKPNVISGHGSVGDNPAVNYHVSVVDTNITTVTDDFGNYRLHGVVAGTGVVIITNDGGKIMRKPFAIEDGQDLIIDFAF